jgi:exodeoxyribonuclease V beta subunit
MKAFDLLGSLPAPATTTVLEASAGTGKTFALAGLVTRYVAEGVATLDKMLLITFSRNASRELRERVRGQIAEAAAALDGAPVDDDNELVQFLLTGTDTERTERRTNLRDALSNFDAATIATTHEFCGVVLKSLGIAGDNDATVTLVENLDDVVRTIVDDLYLVTFGDTETTPQLTHQAALDLARDAVDDSSAQLRPLSPMPGTLEHTRVTFAHNVRAQFELRKRRLGVLSFDDLLCRLASALQGDDPPAREQMRLRWPIVMVDEFQDTDPVQWEVIRLAFGGASTLILIGDPKQAIYGFRGGDIVTYLAAARSADDKQTLDTNWRSDKAVVDSLHVVLGGAALGHPDIVVTDIAAQHTGRRLDGAPRNDPFRLRVVSRDDFGVSGTDSVGITELRRHIGADLAGDIGAVLNSGATFANEPVVASHIAIIVEAHADARACRDALASAGIAAVYAGDSDVLSSDAADDWMCLLEAFDQPNRSGLVRAAAATMFFGRSAEELATEGDALTDEIADTLRTWIDLANKRGVAAVFEAARLAGMDRRVLGVQRGERDMTDLAHICQLLQRAAHEEGLGLPGLRDWLHGKRADGRDYKSDESSRRLDRDAAAVQIMTVHASKGMQYPIVYLPFAFKRFLQAGDALLFHEGEERCLHVGGRKSADRDTVLPLYRQESARNDIRLTYVALTRAQAQVVAWWAPNRDEVYGGLSRLLRDRKPGDAEVRDQCSTEVTDDAAMECFRMWEQAGGLVVERSDVVETPALPTPFVPDDLSARHFDRSVDTSWQRTSYSALIRETQVVTVESEPEETGHDDESGDIPVDFSTSPGADVPSPMAELPGGREFGNLVHGVLEHVDPFAPDLTAELTAHIAEQLVRSPVDVSPDVLAAAMLPMHDTPLGPLAPGLVLRGIGLPDRLCEWNFEFPMAGGDARGAAPDILMSHVGELVRAHLPSDDLLAPYADRLLDEQLGRKSLRGYLSGSVDVVLRVPDGPSERAGPSGRKYIVVDYKTNRLGDSDRPLTAADYGRPQLANAMMHSDYVLQALLYNVVLHRFLRWRQPGYHPERHLGGVMYLFVRGMCGPDTPVVDGHPAGVFSWQPPAALILELSDLLDRGQVAA